MVDKVSDIEEAIVAALKADANVSFPDASIICAQRDANKTKVALSSQGILVSYGQGNSSVQLAHGRPLVRNLFFVVSVGRKVAPSNGIIADDITDVIRCLHGKKIAGLVFRYVADAFADAINNVLWYEVTFSANGVMLEN